MRRYLATDLTVGALSTQKTKEAIVMYSVGKRAWKKKLEEDSALSRNVKTLPFGVRVAGGTSTGPSKKKGKQPMQVAATDIPIVQNVAIEGLNGAECRKWW